MWLDFFLWDIKNWLLERVFWIVVAHVIESCDTLRHISFSFVSLTMLFSNPKKVQYLEAKMIKSMVLFLFHIEVYKFFFFAILFLKF